jgi:hypothetical protein
LHDLAVLSAPGEGLADAGEDTVDDRLRLIFTCCHPALALEARVALTLRTVAGLPTADIARAFLVAESAMTRRAHPGQNEDRGGRVREPADRATSLTVGRPRAGLSAGAGPGAHRT